MGRVKGTLTPPCSKSYAQRALAASLLCGETSVLRNLEFCDDTRSALRCIETLGARVKHVDASTLSIEGGLHPRGKVLHVGESGLATRLFTPIASLCGMPVTIEGQGTLLRRPMHMMIDPLRRLGVRVRDKHFSKTNNDELIKFCRGTGLRRKELQELRGKDLVSRAQIEAEISELQKIPEEQRAPSVTKRLEMLQDARLFPDEWFIHVRNGKGGRERLSPIIGKNAGQIIERITDTPPEEKVWQHVHQSADIHGYRAEYDTAIYKAHARAIEEIPYDRVNRGTGRRYQSEVYTCRKDEAGKKLDKAAMLICSKALGHNRISVVADNYIRGL